MNIVDMFHGTVFILEHKSNTILFEKKVTEALFNIINKVGDEIREDRIYQIVANFSLNSQKKDQVRLYDNVPSAMPEADMGGELTAFRQEENLKTYYEILEISIKNPSVPVSYRSTENDQIYQQRVQDIKY